MYIRGLKFLEQMMNCKNLIVNMCIQTASENANSPIGYKFAFYRNVCAIDIKSNGDVYKCIKRISKCSTLPAEKTCLIHNLCTLIDTRTMDVYIDGFERTEIDYIINHIAEV
jgi:hypothetical protein